MKLLKFIAPKMLIVNGHRSPCECTDTLCCAYCTQANLYLMEKGLAKHDDLVKTSIKVIRENGIRKSARQIGEHEKTLRRWIKTGNIPQGVIEKIAELRT